MSPPTSQRSLTCDTPKSQVIWREAESRRPAALQASVPCSKPRSPGCFHQLPLPTSVLHKLPDSYCTPLPSFLLPHSTLPPLLTTAQETTHTIIVTRSSRACPEDPAKTRTLLADHTREQLSARSCLFLNRVKLWISLLPRHPFLHSQ